MNKTILIVTVLTALVGIFGLIAVSSATADSGHGEEAAPPSASEFREHMFQMRDIMHNALVRGTPLENGVRIEVTGSESGLAEAIREEFASGRHEVKSQYPNSEVSSELIENGVALSFTSEDPATVQNLQRNSTGLFYALLRGNMHELMLAQGGSGGMMGGGMMGGGAGNQGNMMGNGYNGGMMGGNMMGGNMMGGNMMGGGSSRQDQ